MLCNTTLPSMTWNYVMGGLSIFNAVTASVENTAALFVLFWYKNLHTLSNRLLTSLAISDLLAGLTIAPIQAAQLLNSRLNNNCGLNEIRRYLCTLLIGASALSIGAISYDRYLHMSKLNNYNMHMNSRKIAVLFFLAWFIPALIPFLRYLDKSENSYGIVVIVILVNILATIVGCYLMIIIALRRNSLSTSAVSEASLRRQMQATKTVIIIITCYIVMILPICVYLIINMVLHDIHPTDLTAIYLVVMTIGTLNSSLNPVIYYFRNPYFRSNTKKLLTGDFRRGTTQARDSIQESSTSQTQTDINRSSHGSEKSISTICDLD